jgi:hypothetical protein
MIPPLESTADSSMMEYFIEAVGKEHHTKDTPACSRSSGFQLLNIGFNVVTLNDVEIFQIRTLVSETGCTFIVDDIGPHFSQFCDTVLALQVKCDIMGVAESMILYSYAWLQGLFLRLV